MLRWKRGLQVFINGYMEAVCLMLLGVLVFLLYLAICGLVMRSGLAQDEAALIVGLLILPLIGAAIDLIVYFKRG